MPRTEDARFLRGLGQYVDDIPLAHPAYAVFVRSTHSNAAIDGIDCTAALEMAGVLGVYTAAELKADGLGSLPTIGRLKNRDGTRQALPEYPVLADAEVSYVGQPLAMVVADTLVCALDAAEAVFVQYEERNCVAQLDSALAPGAPAVHVDATDNLCLDWATGDEHATQWAFAAATHVSSIELGTNRVIASPMETRGAIGEYEPGSERYTLRVSSQGVHKLQQLIAEHVLHIPAQQLRVLTPDVGGGFGPKIFVYPEYPAVLWAARQTGRAVKWVASRSEAFLADTHARDHRARLELAFDSEARILALRMAGEANLGAVLSTYGSYIPTLAGTGMLTGLYDIPTLHIEVKCVFTNTVPIDAYRGAGKPECNFALERAMDHAARELGLSPWELRRRNLVKTSAMPYRTALGFEFDSGDFESNLEQVMRLSRAEEFEQRRAASETEGKLRGIGCSAYFENTAGYEEEHASLHVLANGDVVVRIGTQSNGQGHETTYAQIVAERLGLRVEQIRVEQGDSEALVQGHGTGGSRSLVMGGAAVLHAAELVEEKMSQIAAHMLEAAAVDVSFADGRFIIQGTDRGLGFAQVAARAYQAARLPPGLTPGLWEHGVGMPCPASYPNGVHVCEVEVDPDTGLVRLVGYSIVDDFGTLINPLIVEGQVHGGTAQGIGQALLEHCVFEAATGQLLSGSFMDYCLPRADDLPAFEVQFNSTPCKSNVLGAKGCGEAGTIAAPAAVINALVDALAPVGVTFLAVPATPETVWRAISAVQTTQAGTADGRH